MKTYTLGDSRKEVLEMIPAQVINKIQLDERVIALVRIGEVFHAFQANCPHRGASLLEGFLSDQFDVVCPLHEYRFNINTGCLKIGSCANLEIYTTELTSLGLNIFLPEIHS